MEGRLIKITNLTPITSVDLWTTFLGVASSNKDEWIHIMITTKDGHHVDQVLIENNNEWVVIEKDSQLFKDVKDYILLKVVAISGEKRVELTINNFIY